jgi:predicted RNase H-like HicB family nuclease
MRKAIWSLPCPSSKVSIQVESLEELMNKLKEALESCLKSEEE